MQQNSTLEPDAMEGQQAEFLPLRWLAGVLTVLLVASVLLAAARLAAPFALRADSAWQRQIDLKPLID